jgi:NAD dependent epimerase/dehydratase family enzyme
MSWISLKDLIAIFGFVIEKELEGPINAVAPNPVTNAEFTETLGKVLGRPTIFPLPAFAARLLFGEMADELLLSSTRVEPSRLLKEKFVFSDPNLEEALI